MPEDAYSWDRLARALRVTLDEFELDLSQVGAQQRLRYEDFEVIFYHLLLVYDPVETKRRFRSVNLARNPEERSKFIEIVVRYINDKKLSSQQRVVTTSQMRILGGEPFRRLLGSLIKAACDVKLYRRKRDWVQAGIQEDTEFEQLLAESSDQGVQTKLIAQKLEEKSAEVQGLMQQFAEAQEKLKRLRVEVAESDREIQDRWTGLKRRNNGSISSSGQSLSVEDASCSGGSTSSVGVSLPRSYDTSAIVRNLLSRLEMSHGKSKVALEKIHAIELPREPTEGSSRSGESAVKKRLSQFIRETARKFDTNQGLDHISPEENQTKLNEQYRHQLAEYDQGVERLFDLWRKEEEKLDEEMLENPVIRASYEKLEKLFPPIKLTPIGAPHEAFEASRKDHGHPEPTLEFIKEILTLYPDNRYDPREILEASKIVFK